MAKKKNFNHPPRETVPRPERYMGLAWLLASMSKDPSTQVGAVIVSPSNRPLGTGYNGPPRQMNDYDIDWCRPHKYPYIRHAERNAIDHSRPRDTTNATIYITGRPCKDCMNDIVEAGISKVIYHELSGPSGSMLTDDEEWAITQDIAKKGIVTLELYQGNLNWMRDWMEVLYQKGVFG